MRSIIYDRHAAVAYAEKWALLRNPEYYSFSGIGGDCTNFVSQCLYAGCSVMNYTPVTGWYYKNINERSASWTSVKYLFRFLTLNENAGPYGISVEGDMVLPGDIVQLGKANGIFYHTALVLSANSDEIYIAAHSDNALWRPLSNYSYEKIRYIHINGARSYTAD